MKRCVICGVDMGKSRSDRRTCSARCRVALSRRLAHASACAALNAYMAADGEDDAAELWDVYISAAARER